MAVLISLFMVKQKALPGKISAAFLHEALDPTSRTLEGPHRMPATNPWVVYHIQEVNAEYHLSIAQYQSTPRLLSPNEIKNKKSLTPVKSAWGLRSSQTYTQPGEIIPRSSLANRRVTIGRMFNCTAWQIIRASAGDRIRRSVQVARCIWVAQLRCQNNRRGLGGMNRQ
jgi:hypothetical protein